MKRWFSSLALLSMLPFSAIAGVYEDTDFMGTSAVPINSLIISLFVVIGVFLIGSALYGFKQASINPNQYPMGNQLMRLIAGASLLSSASIYHMLLGTVGINSSYSNDILQLDKSDLSAAAGDLSNSWIGEYLPTQSLEMIMSLIFLFGVYSFLNGILILKEIGAPQSQQGQETNPIKKSVIHLVAGMIAMNIMDFSCFVGRTIGAPFLCM